MKTLDLSNGEPSVTYYATAVTFDLGTEIEINDFEEGADFEVIIPKDFSSRKVARTLTESKLTDMGLMTYSPGFGVYILNRVKFEEWCDA